MLHLLFVGVACPGENCSGFRQCLKIKTEIKTKDFLKFYDFKQKLNNSLISGCLCYIVLY